MDFIQDKIWVNRGNLVANSRHGIYAKVQNFSSISLKLYLLGTQEHGV